MAGEAFDPDAFLAEPDVADEAPFDPDAFLAEPSEPATPTADAVQYDARPNFVTTPAYQEQRDGENAMLRWAVERAQDTSEGDELTAHRIGAKLGVSPAEVRSALPAFRKADAITSFDVEAWRATAPPEMRRLVVRNPSLAPALIKTQVGGDVSGLLKGMAGSALDAVLHPIDTMGGLFGFGGLDSGNDAVSSAAAVGYANEADFHEKVMSGAITQFADVEQSKAWLEDHAAEVTKARTILAKAQQDFQPKDVQQVDDAAAAEARAGGRTGFVLQRGKEISAGLEESRFRIMRRWAKKTGAGEDELRDYDTRITELEAQSKQRFLGEGELGQLIGLAEQGVISTVQTVPTALERSGEFGAAFALVGGGMSQRAGLGFRSGAATGARLGMKVGALFGSTEASFFVEAGSTDKELSQVVTDDHRGLTDDQILAGSLFAGGIKAGLETLQTTAVLKTLGPGFHAAVAQFFEAGGPKELVKQHIVEPGFRAALARAGSRLVLSASEEGSEEVGQGGTDDVTSYFLKSWTDGHLQKGSIFNKDAAKENFLGGSVGGLLLGSFGTAMGLVSEARQQAASAQGTQHVEQIFQMAQLEAAQSAPAEVAQAVREATTSAGKPVTALHVDAHAIVKYFQEQGTTGPEANAMVADLLGPEAPSKLLEAAATGSKLEIPVATVLGKWGASEIGQALKDDTTTDAGALTARELKQRSAEIETEAIRIADEEVAKLAEASLLSERTQQLEQQLIAEGQSKPQAKAVAALTRAYQATMATDFDKALSEVLPNAPLEVAKGDETAVATEQRLNQEQTDVERQDLGGRLMRATQELEKAPTGRAAAFMDALTGMRNLRGFALLPLKANEELVAVTSTDTKPLNDDPRLGHDQANRMLRAVGQLMVLIDPDAGRGGTNFVARTGGKSSADIAQIVADWRARLSPELQALNVSVAFGTSVEDAMGALEERVDAGRAKGRAAANVQADPIDAELLADIPDAPQLPRERTGTGLDLEKLIANPSALAAGDALARQGAVPQDVQAAAQRAFANTSAFAVDQMMDQSTAPDGMEPVILNKKGFEAAGPRAWTLAFDGIGLKALNAKFASIGRERFGMTRRQATAWGKKQGDILLKAIALASHKMGGAGMAFARLSGDEFAAKHDDQAALLQFGSDLMAVVEELSAGLSVTVDASTSVKVDVGIRWGLGDTYETADQDLNARKQGERGTGPGGDADLPGRGTADERARRAERRGVLPASRLRDGQAGGAGQKVTRLTQDDGAIPKGYTALPAGRALQSTIRVFLNKSADVSTVIHEAGHAFLEQLFDLVERSDAPQRTKATGAAALKAFGVETRKQVTRDHHEQFARAFEKYVFEGQAPSKALAQVFPRFTRWLVSIYRTLAGIPGTELSAELKPVFDAMLATEDQLAAYRKAQGPQPTAQQAAASKAARQAAREQQLQEEADEYTEGSHAAQLRAIKDALRVREDWWKKGLKQLEANFADEYESLPARYAQRLISGEETGEPIVLDRAAVEAVIGSSRVPGLKTVEEGGVRPSVVAEMAGYRSPNAMLAALAGLPSKETWVRAQADATMRQLHPGILDDVKGFRALLADGLRSATEKRLEREVKGLPREALKRAAEKLVQRREVGKLQPGKALSQQRAAAQAKARAMAKGDAVATGAAARAELLNHYLHGELMKAEAEVAKFETLAKRLGKASARERLGKASPAYRDAVDFLRGALGFGEPSELTDATLDAAVAQLEGDAVTIGDPDWLAPVRASLAKGDYQKLTLAELGAVHDALKMLETGARNRTELLVDGKRMDFEAVKTQALLEIDSTLPDKGRIVAKNQRTATEKVRARLSALDGFLLTPIDLVRDLTGDDQSSTLFKVVVNTMRRSAALEADLLEQRVAPVLELFNKMSPEVRKSLGDIVDGRALFPTWNEELEAPRHVDELLSIALNFGSESSRKVVLEGFGITADQVKAALDAHLMPEHIEFVNAVWKTIEALREPGFDLEERLTGLRPKAVAAAPMLLKGGLLNGGYYPLKANPEASTVGARQFGDDQAASLFDPTFTRPGTAHGHFKGRTGATYPVSLDLDVFRKHLMQVAHDIGYREAVMTVARLVMDPAVQVSLTRKLGAEKTKEFLLWLKDIGGASGLQSTPADGFMSFFKKNLSTSALSGLSTAVGNFANLPAAVASTPLKAKHLAAGIAKVLAAPWDMRTGTSTAREAMLEKSGVMRSENSELVQQLQRDIVGLRAGPLRRANEKLREVGMIAMRSVDAIVSTAVWTGAYRQALAEGRTEGEAIRWADDVHSKVQPSKNTAEKSRILRDKGTWVGASTIFYGYLSVAYRAQHRLAAPLYTRDFREASPAKKAAIAAAVAGNMLAFYVAYQVLGDLGMGRGPEDGDRDEEDPENKLLKWRNWFVRKVAVAPLSTIPVIPATAIVEGLVLGKNVSPRADPVAASFFQMSKLIKQLNRDEATGEDIAKALVPLIGAFTGWPTRLVTTSGGYLWQTTVGDREVPNAGRFIGGVIYGEKDGQPDNLPVMLGDGLDPLRVDSP